LKKQKGFLLGVGLAVAWLVITVSVFGGAAVVTNLEDGTAVEQPAGE